MPSEFEPLELQTRKTKTRVVPGMFPLSAKSSIFAWSGIIKDFHWLFFNKPLFWPIIKSINDQRDKILDMNRTSFSLLQSREA